MKKQLLVITAAFITLCGVSRIDANTRYNLITTHGFGLALTDKTLANCTEGEPCTLRRNKTGNYITIPDYNPTGTPLTKVTYMGAKKSKHLDSMLGGERMAIGGVRETATFKGNNGTMFTVPNYNPTGTPLTKVKYIGSVEGSEKNGKGMMGGTRETAVFELIFE